MCNYMGVKVTRSEYMELKSLERAIAALTDEYAIHKGFDYGDFPVLRVKEGTHETERINMQWGFLPPWANTNEKIDKFRKGYKDASGKWIPGYTTLNATSEQLLNKMYRDAALHRRCLVPVNYFYEWMHVQVIGKSGKLLKTPEKFPYLIRMRNEDEFYIAGVWTSTFNTDTQKIINTLATITTDANGVMAQIHNSKRRMPTILPGNLAEAWLYKDLTDQEILDIANYQVASAEMIATPLNKDFLKRENPHEEVIYSEVPKLVYA